MKMCWSFRSERWNANAKTAHLQIRPKKNKAAEHNVNDRGMVYKTGSI